MNFESIENLTVEGINSLFDEGVESIATWFGTWCFTYTANANSKCMNSFTNFSNCPVACDELIMFSTETASKKCLDLCGLAAGWVNFFYHDGSGNNCHSYVSNIAATFQFGKCYVIR